MIDTSLKIIKKRNTAKHKEVRRGKIFIQKGHTALMIHLEVKAMIMCSNEAVLSAMESCVSIVIQRQL